MKKFYIFLIIGLIVAGILAGIYFYNSNKKNNNSNLSDFKYNSTRVATDGNNKKEEEKNIPENNTSNNNDSNNVENTANSETENENTEKQTENEPIKEENQEPKETLLSEYSTKIYSKDPERQNNVKITCSTLNGTTVENGDTFSFTSTVGKATSSKGYKKADVFKDGEKVQALGGGNCQVSSTLYNAVLKTEGLKVTERHEHSNSVPYVPKGKDAAVAYGSYDFKFINNTDSKIKIESSCDKKNVYIKILKIE